MAPPTVLFRSPLAPARHRHTLLHAKRMSALSIKNAIPVRGRFSLRYRVPFLFSAPKISYRTTTSKPRVSPCQRPSRSSKPRFLQGTAVQEQQRLPLTSNFLPWRRPPNPTGSQKSARRNLTTVLPMTSGDMPDAKSPATRPPALAPTAKLTWHATSHNFETSSRNPGPEAFVFS